MVQLCQSSQCGGLRFWARSERGIYPNVPFWLYVVM